MRRHEVIRSAYIFAFCFTFLALHPAGLTAQEPADCPDRTDNKEVYFGDLHAHTSWSFDAVTIGTTTEPKDAFAFAKGSEIALPSLNDYPRGTKKLDQPLDFLALTDHSEYFGELRMCLPCGAEVNGCDEEGILPEDFCKEDPLREGCACWSMQDTVRDGNPHSGSAFKVWALPVLSPRAQRFPICRPDTEDSPCRPFTTSVWQEVVDNATVANERCEFTAFVGYEWTSQPAGLNHHRNVIFKNSDVPPAPITVFETGGAGYNLPTDGAPQLWRLLDEECVSNSAMDCDALAIPHNANLSGGSILPILDVETAAAGESTNRQRQIYFERLMEIHQVKGNSECRMGVGTSDEDCQFELLSKLWLLEPDTDPDRKEPPRARGPVDVTDISAISYLSAEEQGYEDTPEAPGARIFSEEGGRPTYTGGSYNYFQREILKGGLWLANQAEYGGENPFKLGAVGGTDTHSSLPGDTNETSWDGHHGTEDASPETRLSLPQEFSNTIDGESQTPIEFSANPKHTFTEMNPGGLAAVWAPQNTRDDIFGALKNRETYATSGNRPRVRFFASQGSNDFTQQAMCGALNEEDFASIGYSSSQGVSMGGTLNGSAEPPTFAVWATRDTANAEAGNIQRIQIIKGWIDNQGGLHEVVYEIADDGIARRLTPDEVETYVSTDTCQTTGKGEVTLCAVWTEADFDATQDAFYYVRVLETPTCRWSTRQCNELNQIKSASGDCSSVLADAALTNEGREDGVIVEPAIQERAWTSPIWFEANQ